MPTGQFIINRTAEILNIIDPNGTLGAGDSAAILNQLNAAWDAWSVDEGLIYAVVAQQFPLTAYQQNYTIGSGATFNTQLPARIYKAFVVSSKTFSGTTQSNTTVLVSDTTGLYIGQGVKGVGIPSGTTILAVTTNTSITISQAATASSGSPISLVAIGLNRNELKVVEAGQYYSHNDLGAAAATPEELYPDFDIDPTSGYARLYVWPVANEVQPSYLEIETAVPFSTWTLVDNYNIPAGYQDALQWALAFRCLAVFGAAINSDVAKVVAVEGVKAEARIREANRVNRQLTPQAVMAPGTPTQQQPAVQ